jgi:hypothetical protein
VLTGNSAGFITVLSSRLSHKKLRSPLRESHSFLSLPADTTMASSQGTQFIQQMSIARYIPFQIPLLTPILRFLFFFSYNIMADVASKQHKTALFLSTTVTRTRHTKVTKKYLTSLMGNLCCAREHSVQFFVQIFTQFNLGCMGPFTLAVSKHAYADPRTAFHGLGARARTDSKIKRPTR